MPLLVRLFGMALHVLWCYPLQDARNDLVHTVCSGMSVVKKGMKIRIKSLSLNFRELLMAL